MSGYDEHALMMLTKWIYESFRDEGKLTTTFLLSILWL